MFPVLVKAAYTFDLIFYYLLKLFLYYFSNNVKIAVMIASHNEDTVRYTVKKMAEHGIHPLDRVICFGQLLGMCDHISLPLGK